MAAPPRSPTQADATASRLNDLVARRPELAEAAAFYRATIPLLRQAQHTVPPLALDPAIGRQKIAAGRPMLIGEELPLDAEATSALFLRLSRIVEESAGDGAAGQRPGRSLFRRASAGAQERSDHAATSEGASRRAGAARHIRQAVEQGRLDLPAVWAALASGDSRGLEDIAARLALDPGLLRVLAENSLMPALRAWAQDATQGVTLDQWRRGHCPVCGNMATLAEIKGKEGERRLRCRVCGAGWHYPRLQCAHCQCREPKMLGYIAVAGEEEKYRLQSCDHCRGYLKVVVTFEPIAVEQLPVEELATLHLDQIASERGFSHSPILARLEGRE
jgi:FdhE protein